MSYAFQFPSNPPDFATQPTQSRVLTRNVRNFIDKELILDINNKHLILAVSGGADSLALLCLWIWLRPIYHHTLSVCHIDHMLRPESELEAHSIAALCAAWDIDFHVEKVDVNMYAKEKKIGLEEAARHVRYTQLEKYRKSCKADWICLAHHLGDLQEDILMRLIRGSGWPALGGMQAIDYKRHILRPLLLQDKASLYALLQHANIGFAHDKSNDDHSFLRNRLRHKLIPLLEAENPNFKQKASELWKFASYDALHWQNIIQQLFMDHNIHNNNNCVQLPPKLLKQVDKATRLRLYMHAIQLLTFNNCHNIGQARAHTLLELDAALTEGRGNTTFQLPGHIEAKLKKSTISFILTTA